MTTKTRYDLDIIQRWVKPGARVLDLGCGNGSLLAGLKASRDIQGYGIEIDPGNISQSIAAGVNVIQQDLNADLSCFASNSFDLVVMTQALQAVQRPDHILGEMLRIGKEGVITFPNFAYWRTRFYLALKGRMPISDTLPHRWYDTPNIHLCTFNDFEALCHEKDFEILNRMVVDNQYGTNKIMQSAPNLLGEIAVYRVTS